MWLALCHFWIATEAITLTLVSEWLKLPRNEKSGTETCAQFSTTSEGKNQNQSGELQCCFPLWG